MANDIDMYKDIEEYSNEPLVEADMIQDLLDCYSARYQEGDLKEAEEFKQMFEDKWGFWGNWY